MSIMETLRKLDKEFAIQIRKLTCHKARAYVLTLIKGSANENYNLFPSYIEKLRRVNRDSFFDLLVDKLLALLPHIFRDSM